MTSSGLSGTNWNTQKLFRTPCKNWSKIQRKELLELSFAISSSSRGKHFLSVKAQKWPQVHRLKRHFWSNSKLNVKIFSYVWFSALFGPVGALLRHILGLKLNGFKGFPLGTFCANVIGCLIYTILFSLKQSIGMGQNYHKNLNLLVRISRPKSDQLI